MIQSLKKIVQKFLALDEQLTRTFDGSFYQMATLKQWLIIIILNPAVTPSHEAAVVTAKAAEVG
jgi:hypothetical protein